MRATAATQLMLILTRRVQETIVIGEGARAIRVTILSVSGNHVRLGIEAPRDVDVHRQEIYDRIQRERGKEA